jgi:DNA-binding LytR/AlgR family response regulator
MIKAAIIEDEKHTAEYLCEQLKQTAPDIAVAAVLRNVEEGIAYFSAGHKVDIIFSDVQLGDGLSFAIFAAVGATAPVVFITAYDRFMMDAFENNGIDYLLKPVCQDELQKAIEKYRHLERHFKVEKEDVAFHQLMHYVTTKKRSRILVRRGIENISLPLQEIVLFFTENKIAYAVDRSGRKLMVDKNLSDLEKELDEKLFFRANRQYLLNIDYIKSFKPYERVKLWVDLTVPHSGHSIIVSQETAPFFRKWLLEA